MIRANVYSIESLGQEHERAVRDGFDMLCQQIGKTVAFRTLRVRLPLTSTGFVTPSRVGVRKLDRAVDLHVFAVPLDRGPNNDRLGAALPVTGLSFIDINQDPKRARLTAIHEGAHSLGFVLPFASQSNPDSPGHCVDGGCIMHMGLGNTDGSAAAYVSRLGQRAKVQLPEGVVTRESLGLPQDEFCIPCQSDLTTHGSNLLEAIHQLRATTGEIIPAATTELDLPS